MARSRLLSFTGLAQLAGFAPGLSADPPATTAGSESPTADPPASDPHPAVEPGTGAATEASLPAGDYVLASDALRLAQDAQARGFSSANERMKAVLASPEAADKTSNAVFLLAHSSADAPTIIQQLKDAPGAAVAAAAPITPRIDLTGGNGGATASEEGAGTGGGDPAMPAPGAIWKQVQGKDNGLGAAGSLAAPVLSR